MTQVLWPELAHKFRFRLSVAVKEISDDLEHALAVAKELGIQDVEISELWGERIGIASQEKLDRARDLLDTYEMGVRIVSPWTFKSLLLGSVPLDFIEDELHFQEEMYMLKRQIAAARLLGAPLTRVFSFRREGMIGLGNPSARYPRGGEFPEDMQEKVARALSLACEEAEKAEIILAVEHARACWCNSGYNTSLILERVNSPWLRAIWDPANAFVAGEEDAYPAGYEAVRPYISHVHLKDAVVVDRESGLTRWACIGDGRVDLVGQMKALKEDGYDQCASIETHWSPPGGDPESNTRACYAGLMSILAQI